MKNKSFSVVLMERIESKDRMKTKSFSGGCDEKRKATTNICPRLGSRTVGDEGQKRYDPIYLIPLCRCLFVRERIGDVHGFPLQSS